MSRVYDLNANRNPIERHAAPCRQLASGLFKAGELLTAAEIPRIDRLTRMERMATDNRRRAEELEGRVAAILDDLTPPAQPRLAHLRVVK
jgi:hypothetical protein